MKTDLSGKIAVVTGAGGVLCSRFAVALAQSGAKVALLNRTLAKAEKIEEEIKALGGEAISVQVDVTSKESCEKAHEEVVARLGKCDILINGAGGNNPIATADEEFFSEETMEDPAKKSFFDLDQTGFTSVFGLNIVGVLLPTQVFARDLAEKKNGVIINVSSMNAYRPLTKIPAYSAAKAAVSNFTQWLAVYFAQAGIRCNAIAPGFFSTAQNKALLWNEDGTPTARTGKILRNTPMGRFGEPEELLGTLLWLCDDNASGFVTGITVPVDGGFSAYSGV
ncbi:MAG: SDR family oxidoreductase [Oscillospiraceae bacterium]|nr:SDR family oxidoreductase [Oscillospiraceae bacterium]